MKDWFTIQKAVGVHIADVSELRPCTNVSIETATILVTSRQKPSVPKASHVMRNMIAGMCRRIMWSKSLASRSRTHSHYDPMTCAQFPRALALKPLVMRRLGLLRLAKQSDVNRSETLKSSNSFLTLWISHRIFEVSHYFSSVLPRFVCITQLPRTPRSLVLA